MSWLVALLAGLFCGVFSGLGIGGGTLLMVWMTAVAGIAQKTAQGINLLYFLPTAACSLIFHIKNRLICWRIVLPAAIAGSLAAVGAAFLANTMETELLRKLFGGFLIFVGIRELFVAQRRDKKAK